MSERITVSGIVGDIKTGTSKKDQKYISFQLTVEEGPRRGSKSTVRYTVNAFRQLAENASRSLSPGDRLLVSGTVKEVLLKQRGELVTKRAITAEHIGHDMFWGISEFTRLDAAALSQGINAEGVQA